MNADLSAFYFDIRKDALYCDPPSSAQAARRAGGDRPYLPRRHAMAGADPRLHLRGGVGIARRRTRSSVHLEQFPDDSRAMARRSARRQMGEDPPPALGRDRRDRDRPRQQGDRLVAGGAPARLHRRRRAARARSMASISPKSASPRISRSSLRRQRRTDAFRLPDTPGVAVVVERARGHQMRAFVEIFRSRDRRSGISRRDAARRRGAARIAGARPA